MHFVQAVVPHKPRNLTVTNITSRSADVSWLDPANPNDQGYSHRYVTKFFIIFKKDKSIVLNITTDNRIHDYEINSLIPYTTYEISVAAGNDIGYGKEAVLLFLTSKEGMHYTITA